MSDGVELSVVLPAHNGRDAVEGVIAEVVATVVAGAWVVVVASVGVVTTGPTRRIAGAGSSSSVPDPSDGMAIQRISPTSQRWTNGK